MKTGSHSSVFRWGAVLGLLLIFLAATAALAAGEGLPRSVVSSGGGVIQATGRQVLASIGQPVVGAVSGPPLTLCSGFICGEGAPPVSQEGFKTFLPRVSR